MYLQMKQLPLGAQMEGAFPWPFAHTSLSFQVSDVQFKKKTKEILRNIQNLGGTVSVCL